MLLSNFKFDSLNIVKSILMSLLSHNVLNYEYFHLKLVVDTLKHKTN